MFVFKKIYELEQDEMDRTIEKMLIDHFPIFLISLEIIFNIPIGIACIVLEIYRIFLKLTLSYLGAG